MNGRKRTSILPIVVGAMMASQVVYAVVAFGVVTRGSFSPAKAGPLPGFPLSPVSVMVAMTLCACVLTVVGAAARSIVTSVKAPADLDAAYDAYSAGVILQHALFEATGLVFLIGILFSGQLQILGFSAVSLALHLAFFPWPNEPSELENKVRQLVRER